MDKTAIIILSGDIGGTNTRLQLTEFSGKQEIKILARENYLNSEHADFLDIIELFLKKTSLSRSPPEVGEP